MCANINEDAVYKNGPVQFCTVLYSSAGLECQYLV